MTGQTLGHYRIIEKIGAGGMGEVYRATDARLGREVAIKLLPDAFARDPERLARFDQEARLLAALNHPNIAAIYGLEEAQDGGPGRAGRIQFLVLELVPGETLAERLSRGPLPVEEALGVCRQIAEALEAAHERGIIHRDLKPANVKVTPEGKVKVLDFGLAKAFAPDGSAGVQVLSPSPAPGASPGDSPGGVAGAAPGARSGPAGGVVDPLSQSPTATYGMTRDGVILGTAGYMSPEQARGKPLDKRTDIWSFGCVLYEVLAGKQAFGGETISDTIANILNREPDWSAVPAGAPAGARRLLRRCLEKKAERRLRDSGDVRIEIEDLLAAPEGAQIGREEERLERRGWRVTAAWSVACVMALLAASATVIAIRSRSGARQAAHKPVTRFTIQLPPSDPVALGESLPSMSISPDGTKLVYVAWHGGERELRLRALDRLESEPIPGTSGASDPFFSPDSQWVGFASRGKLNKVALRGGAPIPLCDAPRMFGASWGEDGTILFTPDVSRGLHKVPAGGGEPQGVTTPDPTRGEHTHMFPEILPNGKAALFWIWRGGPAAESRIAVVSLETGERRDLIQHGANPTFSPTGHLVYLGAGGLMAAQFDLAGLRLIGEPFATGQAVLRSVFGSGYFSLSRQGVLGYLPGGGERLERELAWVDRTGRVTPLTESRRAFTGLRMSPDGKRLAVQIAEENSVDLWVYDLARSTFTRLTFEGVNGNPSWTPDGRRLAFNSTRSGPYNLYSLPVDASGAAEPLAPSMHGQAKASWSPDGMTLAYTQTEPETGSDIWVLPRVSGGMPRPFLRSRFNESDPEYSPDGRFLAYCSDESGRSEVYVQNIGDAGGRWQVSSEGGLYPRWASSGRELFYRQGNRIMSVTVAMRPGFSAGKARLLLQPRFPADDRWSTYDVAPDGQRFVIVQAGKEEASPSQIHVVLNWTETLKRSAPAGER